MYNLIANLLILSIVMYFDWNRRNTAQSFQLYPTNGTLMSKKKIRMKAFSVKLSNTIIERRYDC